MTDQMIPDGLTEEWGVTYATPTGSTTQWADNTGQPLTRHTARLLARDKARVGCLNVRVVRRCVTEPEEIK